VLLVSLFTLDAVTLSFGYRDNAPIEKLLRCSDLVVRCIVTKKYEQGVYPSSSKMIHTKYTCDVKSYYVGTGPEQISLFIPGGIYTGADGHPHLTQIPTIAAVRKDEELIAFLHRLDGGYRFVNQWGSKIEIDRSEDHPVPTVKLIYQNPKYLSKEGRAMYEQHDKRYEGAVDADGNPLKPPRRDTYIDFVPLDKVGAIIDLAVSDIGGPKPENLTCH
jgi:hypothetical protein